MRLPGTVRVSTVLLALCPALAAAHEHNGSVSAEGTVAFGSPVLLGPTVSGEYAFPWWGHNTSVLAEIGEQVGNGQRSNLMGGFRYSFGKGDHPTWSGWSQVMAGARRDLQNGSRFSASLGVGCDLGIHDIGDHTALAWRVQVDLLYHDFEGDKWSGRVLFGPSIRFEH